MSTVTAVRRRRSSFDPANASPAALIDETVKRAVRALTRGKGLDAIELAQKVGIPRTTFYRRLSAPGSESAFTAGEVGLIADALGVPVGDLYSGLGGAVAVTSTGTATAR